jgi:carbonic anhydrase
MRRLVWILGSSFSLGTSQCARTNQGNEFDAPAGHSAESEQADHGGEAHWGYEGEAGPGHRADLTLDFALCREGTEQSPCRALGNRELRLVLSE